MIRPITCVTVLLAAASGLYLYQTKHKVHVLDAQIEQVVHQTEQVREQTRVLHAEWTLLDQPDRLQQLATQFLALQPTQPSQFTTAADLNSRLPPPQAPTPAPAPPVIEEAPVVASAVPPDAPTASATTAKPPRREPTAVAALAAPQSPSVRVVDHPAPHPAERVVEPSRTMLAAVRTPPYAAPAPRAAPSRLMAASLPRPVPLYPPAYQPAYSRSPVAVAAAAPAYGGSMLGMARGAAPPPPAPAPVWVNWNR